MCMSWCGLVGGRLLVKWPCRDLHACCFCVGLLGFGMVSRAPSPHLFLEFSFACIPLRPGGCLCCALGITAVMGLPIVPSAPLAAGSDCRPKAHTDKVQQHSESFLHNLKLDSRQQTNFILWLQLQCAWNSVVMHFCISVIGNKPPCLNKGSENLCQDQRNRSGGWVCMVLLVVCMHVSTHENAEGVVDDCRLHL